MNFIILYFLELNLKILHKLQVLEQKSDITAVDVRKIKAALIRKTDSNGADQLFHMEKFTNDKDFEDFFEKISTDENFRELYVSFHFHVKIY